VHHNHFGICLQAGAQTRVRNNFVHENAFTGISTTDGSANEISGNRVIASDTGIGVEADSDSVIHHNFVLGHRESAIAVSGAGTIVRNNTVRLAPFGIAVFLAGGAEAVSNNIQDTLVGLVVFDCIGCTVSRNNVTQNNPGGAFPEGGQRALLELRVTSRVGDRARIPARLSTLAAIDTAHATERPIRLGFAKGRWRINDRVFVMGETPIEAKRNTVETWLLRNYFNSMPHAMHLHGFAFEVLERQTSPDQVAALKVDDRGRLATDLGRKDTVLVWPGESVRIAIDFSLPATPAFAADQIFMFHCHNLEHEDGGMMVGVRVG